MRKALVITALIAGLLSTGCLVRSGDVRADGARSGDATGLRVNVTSQRTYTRVVHNPFAFAVAVTVNGRQVGWLAGHRRDYLMLPEGEYAVALVANGQVLAEELFRFGPTGH